VTPPAAAAVKSPPEPITTSPAPLKLEATARALITGGAIGLVLAAGNVYTALKVSIIDGGSITAALLSFSLFASFRRLGRTPSGALENNITHTVASSAAVMSFVTGVVGPFPALTLMGTTFPAWAIVFWGAALGTLGIFVGTLLRRRLIVEEKLPFPTGQATGELIETIYGAHHTAIRRTRLLVAAAVLSAAVTWFRDARPALIPQATMLPGVLAGVSLATLTVGVSWSPLMLSTGAMLGVRMSASMLLGGVLARLVLAPWLVNTGTLHDAEFGSLNSWMIWPSLGLLIAGSFVPLMLEGGAVRRSLRDLASLVRGAGRRPNDGSLSVRMWAPLVLASLLILFVVGGWFLGMPPSATAIAVVLSLFLANISARATGETDWTPAGAVGTVAVVALAGRGTANSVLGGSIVLGTSSQVGPTLWAFRAGHHLGASPRAQVGAQLLGVLLGAVVVVPVYYLVVGSYGLATEKIPAVAALSFKATAEAVRGGLGALPPHASSALLVGVGVGTLLTVLGRGKRGGWWPSPTAMGVAMMMPFSTSFAIALGAILVLGVRRGLPAFDEPSTVATAAGGIAGESVIGVIIAALLAAGAL